MAGLAGPGLIFIGQSCIQDFMDIALRDTFTRRYEKYFPGSELPVTIEIGGNTGNAARVPEAKTWKCLVCDLMKARNGTSLIFDASAVSCAGGKIYTGFEAGRSPEFRYFISSGKGDMKGERYKQTPELVDEWTRGVSCLPSQGKAIAFRRWDKLTAADNPEVVVFFARPEVISGLFTLANFDRPDPDGVICPFGAGCSSVVHYPWLEQQKDDPKAVLGMLDPSARPCVATDVMTIAFPMKKFVKVVGFMEESFLITETWGKVQKKIARSNTVHKS